MAGLTAAGFVAKVLEDIRDEIGLDLQTSPSFGPGVNLEFDGPIGQSIGSFSIQLADAWSALQGVYDSRDPDAAEGAQLDNLSAIVGVTRLGATFSEVELDLVGSPSVVIPAFSQVRIPNGPLFIIQTETTLDFAGLASGVLALAEETGPVSGIIGAVSEIVTAVAGWDTVTNPADVIAGRTRETDAQLRVRRESSLQIVGAGPDQAIRARLLEVSQVQAAAVISNREFATDALGIEGKAFRSVVFPSSPDPEDIALAIYESQPAGIKSTGAVEVEITDSQGFTQTVRYSIATSLDLYLDAILTVNGNYPTDGDTQVAQALFDEYKTIAAGGKSDIGTDVILLDGICAVKGKVPGILTLELRALFGSAPGPADIVNLPVELTQISLASQSPGRITVSS